MGQRKGHCSVADAGCAAPAGIGVQGAYAECDPAPVVTCKRCGEECSMRVTLEGTRGRYCHNCIGEKALRRLLLEKV